MPITKAAYELAKTDGYYDELPAAEVGIQQLSLPGGEWSKGYRMGFYPQIREVMEREYGKIFAGETSVDDAMKTIEEEGNELLERFAKTVELTGLTVETRGARRPVPPCRFPNGAPRVTVQGVS